MIKEELLLERQHSDELKLQLEALLEREERGQEDVDQLSAQVQDQEALIRELEETANFYSEQLRYFDEIVIFLASVYSIRSK